jgi:hypothetical protein
MGQVFGCGPCSVNSCGPYAGFHSKFWIRRLVKRKTRRILSKSCAGWARLAITSMYTRHWVHPVDWADTVDDNVFLGETRSTQSTIKFLQTQIWYLRVPVVLRNTFGTLLPTKCRISLRFRRCRVRMHKNFVHWLPMGPSHIFVLLCRVHNSPPCSRVHFRRPRAWRGTSSDGCLNTLRSFKHAWENRAPPGICPLHLGASTVEAKMKRRDHGVPYLERWSRQGTPRFQSISYLQRLRRDI